MTVRIFRVPFEGIRKMGRRWEADTSTSFVRQLGKSASELGQTDVTTAFTGRLPADVKVAQDERVVVIPRSMIIAAKPDILDA